MLMSLENFWEMFLSTYFVQLRTAKVKRIHSHGNTSTCNRRGSHSSRSCAARPNIESACLFALVS